MRQRVTEIKRHMPKLNNVNGFPNVNKTLKFPSVRLFIFVCKHFFAQNGCSDDLDMRYFPR